MTEFKLVSTTHALNNHLNGMHCFVVWYRTVNPDCAVVRIMLSHTMAVGCLTIGVRVVLWGYAKHHSKHL